MSIWHLQDRQPESSKQGELGAVAVGKGQAESWGRGGCTLRRPRDQHQSTQEAAPSMSPPLGALCVLGSCSMGPPEGSVATATALLAPRSAGGVGGWVCGGCREQRNAGGREPVGGLGRMGDLSALRIAPHLQLRGLTACQRSVPSWACRRRAAVSRWRRWQRGRGAGSPFRCSILPQGAFAASKTHLVCSLTTSAWAGSARMSIAGDWTLDFEVDS